MKETTRQAAIEAVNKHDFLFLIAGTRNKDGSFSTQRIIEGKTCDLAIPLAMALKDEQGIEKCVCKIRVQEKIPKMLHELAEVLSQEFNQNKKKGKSKND